MVKRKYLIIILLISQYHIFSTYSYASAYLPKTGSYKYSFSAASIDKTSREKRNYKINAFIQIQDSIYQLGQLRADIIMQAQNESRELRNSEKLHIEIIDQDIKESEKIAKELAAFNDDIMSYFEVEYGVADNHSFGLKIDYYTSKLAEIKNDKTKKAHHIGKSIESFYKYKLFENDNFILTLQPKFQYSLYHKQPSYRIDVGLLAGHSSEHKKYTSFQEFAITARKYFDRNTKKSIGYVVSISEGMKFNNNIIISNYTEYEKKDSQQWIYKATIYDQISVAKTFTFGNLGEQKLAAQVGYFWKTSVANASYIISGPIISLWLDL